MKKEKCNKLILDATCGSRMMWFNKENPIAVYVDRREIHDEKIWKSGNGKSVRYCNITPDIIADFTHLPFPDDSFYHVVFDPPHLTKIGDNAWLAKKYGKLDEDWKKTLHDGFWECMRVLKPYGTLIFKWCEVEIPTKEVIKVIKKEPLYGHRSGKKSNTHWMCFMKEGETE